jgi:hypothetical protein
MARLSKAGTGKPKIAMTDLRKTERRKIAANRRAAKWKIFSTAFASVTRLPSRSTSTNANDWGRNTSRLIRVLVYAPSLKSQHTPAGFSALLRRNFDLFGHAPDG